MKILFVGNYAPDGQASMLAFRRVLERELPSLGCEVRVIAPAQRVLRVPASSRWWKWLGYVDKFILFIPSLVRHVRWADVVHIGDHSNGMYVPWVKSKPNVITCHDVIAIQAARGMIEGWKVGWTGRLFQHLIVRGLARADLVACVSHLTRRDLLALDLAHERRVVTVLNGLNDEFSPVVPEEAERLIRPFGLSVNCKFLLHVGADLPRKNRKAVVETFVALQQRAAAAGAPPIVQQMVFVGPELAVELAALVQEHGLADRIKTVQNVAHEELRALYTSATALLFPSLQEGFGWPVIEAQACGCPVFTSDLAPMNEIGGLGVEYIDPHHPTDMAEAIERAAPRLAEMRRLGLVNASHYTTARMTSGYVATYRRVLEERKAPRKLITEGSRG
ncbi:D-inositol 3-phosphate glycosyltransferase (plasmid) [Variovorax sp. WDL1]|nr:D-inositol 3-phosphate glycosyltransferase [Variovorax sp. B4]PNG49767.1 D-inositol 3-phosphate glycosyltransferase [Variovorax sp. B2]VTV18521.1 D-inositol 3-phosphate glycosyltransferase [Variovorax sp. WDL1]